MTSQDLVHWDIIQAWMVELNNSIHISIILLMTKQIISIQDEYFFCLSSCKTFRKNLIYDLDILNYRKHPCKENASPEENKIYLCSLSTRLVL